MAGKRSRFFIIIPTRNSAEYLDRCLASVLLVQPGSHDVRVHIQDNLSTDGTQDIAAKWSSHDVTFKSEPDDGLYDAVAKASSKIVPGEIMTWLGSDDFLLPGALSTVASAFQAYSNVLWLTGLPFVGSDDEGSFDLPKMVRYSRKDLSAGLHDGRSRGFVMQEGTFWRTDLWLQVGGIDNRYRFAGDWDLWRRFAQITPLYVLELPLARFTFRDGQLSSDMQSYYQEVDSAPKMPAVEDDTTYKLWRGAREPWRIQTDSRKAAFSLHKIIDDVWRLIRRSK